MTSDTFSKYTQELSLSKYTPLQFEEERKLLFQYAEGSQEAFQKIVNAHLRYVVFFLRNYTIPRHVDIMDVIQEANFGMMEGVRRYDATRYTCRVFSFCFYYVRLSISKFLKGVQKERSLFLLIGDDTDIFVTTDDIGSQDINQVAKDIIENSLFELDTKERTVIILLFGLKPPYKPKSLQEVGSIFNLSAERVRQIKDEALAKLEKKEIETHL